MRQGDFILTQDPTNPISQLIEIGEQGAFSHAAIVTGDNLIAEALADGVQENPIHYERYGVFEIIGITDEQRAGVVDYAKSHLGEGYGLPQDIGFAINGFRELLGIERIPNLLSNKNMPVCSAFVDLCFTSKGIILRPDREPGDITPQGLSYSTRVRLIENHNLWEL